MNVKSTILVVDDNDLALKATARILKQGGYEVFQATNGVAALAQVRFYRPFLVLLDVVMPDLSGTEVLRQIRADPALSAVSVVLLSSQTESENRAKGLDAGADGYIARPLASAELLARVRLHLRQRELTEELRASQEQLLSAFESAAIGMAVVALKGPYLKVNRAFCKMLGYTEEQLLMRTFRDITHPDDFDERIIQQRLISAEIDSYQAEKRYFHRDGHLKWGLMSVSLVRDAAGEPIHEIVQIQDITERKLAEAAARGAADLLRAIVDGTPDAVFIKDREGRYLLLNHAGAVLAGRTVAEVLGLDDQEIFGSEGAATTQANDHWVMESNRPQTVEEVLTAAGVTRTFSTTKAPYRDDTGAVIGVIGISRDITERNLLERLFLRAQRMESIGTLAGGIAHDLNNVLAPILMALDIFKTRFPDPASQELIDLIGSSARRGADMVRQVLSFARGVEGRREEVEIREVMEEICKIANDTFMKHVQVRTIFTDDLWPVIGDATQIHQVLLNLCVNARDAMPNGGMLTLCAENLVLDAQYAALNPDATPGPHVLLKVQDTGTGMPPEVMEQIFDPFFSTKEISIGTGLGLSTSLAIIKSHGGFIRVSSEVGVGTTFMVHLPAQSGNSSTLPSVPAAEIPRGNGELILIVDDEATVREITRQTLEAYGYQVLLAADGVEGVAAYTARGSEIAAVLTDMTMPVMDGLAMIQILRRMNPEVHVVAVSGLSVYATDLRSADLRVGDFLLKPYTAETLLRTLRQAL